MRDKERRVLDGRRKAIEEKRKLLESQASGINPPSHDAKQAGASVASGPNHDDQPHYHPTGLY